MNESVATPLDPVAEQAPIAPRDADERPPGRSSAFAFWATLFLILPASLPYVAHWLPHRDGLMATGYVQYDFPLYYGKAREHFDSGSFRWTYSQPAGESYDSPRIYVQPWTLAVGLAHRWAGLPPGVIYDGFWLVTALFCSASAVALYRELVGLGTWSRRLGLVIFFWGGGLLAALGAFAQLVRGQPIKFATLFQFDPADGWWFLNFGRNLIYPTEALYHGLVFLTLLAVVRRRFLLATALAVVTTIDSPFAGSGLLAVLWVWGLVETSFLRNRARVAGFFVAVKALLIGFVAYYLVYLNRFPEHRLVARQMEFDVTYNALAFVPALVLVAGFALWTYRDSERAARRLGAERNRLLLVWFLVTFVLSQHEFAIRPRQPIHFDRGYVWTALFFLGAPALIGLFEGLMRRLPKPIAIPALAGVVLVMLSDNILWFAQFPVSVVAKSNMNVGSIRVTPDQAAALKALDNRAYEGDLVLSEDERLAYLAVAETRLRSWYSHNHETPRNETRRQEMAEVFRSGTFLAAWERRSLLVVLRTRPDEGEGSAAPRWVADRGGTRVYRNPSFEIYRILPSEQRPNEPKPAPRASIRALLEASPTRLKIRDAHRSPIISLSAYVDSTR